MDELDKARKHLTKLIRANPNLAGVEIVDVGTTALLDRHAMVGGVCLVGAKAYKMTEQQVQNWRDSYKRVPNYEFIGVDIEAGLNVDVVADLCSPTFVRDHPKLIGRFGLVVCGALLEHVKDPFAAARNVAAMIKPDGHLYYLGPWVWGFHAYPDDYWRFSFSALQQLFPDMAWKEWWYSGTDKRIGLKVPKIADERAYLQIVRKRRWWPRSLGELITDRAMPYLNVGAIAQRPQRKTEMKTESTQTTEKPSYEALEMERNQLLVVYGTLNRRHLGNIPMPPEVLRLHVGARPGEGNFLAQGSASSERVLQTFGEAPAFPVLDWGCGSGRTWRWLQAFPRWREMYHGTDVDAEAIAWLRGVGANNLTVCGDNPPLPVADGFFGGLFAFSVLTHIPPDKHRLWYQEIRRVLRPGARAFLTTQGERIVREKRVSDAIANEYRGKGAAYARHEGHYKDAALVSEGFTRSALAGVLDVVEYTESGYQNMDVILVQRPESG